jgi:hypothetical protein
VVHVSSGAPAGGTGTRDAPFDRIADALAVASAGSVVAVAAGTYAEDIVVPTGVTVWGACAAQTTLAGAASAEAIVTIDNADAVLRDLTISGEQAGVWVATAPARVALRGVVIEGVRLAGISAADADVTLEDVAIRALRPSSSGAYGRGLHLARGTLAADRVVIEDALDVGVFLAEADARLTDVAVLGTGPQPADGARGHGLHGQFARITVERATFEDNHRVGLTTGGDGGELRVTDLVVRRTLLSNESSRALDVEQGSHLAMSRVLITDHEDLGLLVHNGSVEASDVLVARTTSGAEGLTGRGIALQLSPGAMSRVLVAGAVDMGVFVAGFASDVTLEDVTVRDVALGRSPEEASGIGIACQHGATAALSRVLVEGAESSGLYAGTPDTDMTVTDFVVRRSGSALYSRGVSSTFGAVVRLGRGVVEGYDEIGLLVAADGAFLRGEDLTIRDTTGDGSVAARVGRAVSAQMGSRLELARVAIERVGDSGIACVGPDASCSAEDVTITDVAAAPTGHFGRGVYAQDASLDLSRASIRRATEVGLAAQGELSVARATDIVVRDTRSGAEGHFGRGILASVSATVEIERAVLEGNREVGAGAFVGGQLRLTDVVVRNTQVRSCAEDVCEGLGAGIGIAAIAGGVVSVQGFVVEDNALIGLQIARDGAMDATDGVVRGNPVGANVQVPGYDVARISDGVRYEDNGRRLDATELYVPSP